MHDTGKIGTPDAILKKPGKLNAKEWEIMKQHTQIGYDILSKSKSPLFQMAAEIALHHHEKWNGHGYPHGLSGEDIPESARIVAIADVFDALTMKRPYKDAWPVAKAFDELKAGRGLHFDPRLLDCFFDHQLDFLAVKEEWEMKEAYNVKVV
jgi:putative two-component system response regulator